MKNDTQSYYNWLRESIRFQLTELNLPNFFFSYILLKFVDKEKF